MLDPGDLIVTRDGRRFVALADRRDPQFAGWADEPFVVAVPVDVFHRWVDCGDPAAAVELDLLHEQDVPRPDGQLAGFDRWVLYAACEAVGGAVVDEDCAHDGGGRCDCESWSLTVGWLDPADVDVVTAAAGRMGCEAVPAGPLRDGSPLVTVRVRKRVGVPA